MNGDLFNITNPINSAYSNNMQNFYNFYKLFNTDLQKLNNKQLVYHYDKFGKNEKRIYSIESFYDTYPNYNIDQYKNNNKNLNFKNDYEYMIHYHLYGKYTEFNGNLLVNEISNNIYDDNNILYNSIKINYKFIDIIDFSKKIITIYINSLYYNENSENYYFKTLSEINYNDCNIIIITNDKNFIKQLIWLQYIIYFILDYDEISNELNYCKINNLLNYNFNIENKKIYLQYIFKECISTVDLPKSEVCIGFKLNKDNMLELEKNINLNENNYELLVLSDYVIYDYIINDSFIKYQINIVNTSYYMNTCIHVNMQKLAMPNKKMIPNIVNNIFLINDYKNCLFISENKVYIYIYSNKIIYHKLSSKYINRILLLP